MYLETKEFENQIFNRTINNKYNFLSDDDFK